MLVEIGALMTIGSLAGIAFEVLNSPAQRFRRQVLEAMDRANLYVVVNRLGKKVVERPRLIGGIKVEKFGYSMKFKFPVGLPPKKAYDALDIIESATESEIELDYSGQMVTFKFYTHPLPEPGSPEATFNEKIIDEIRKYPLALPIGYSRSGFTIHTMYDGSAAHMMLGGQTGMGKSNLLNLIITSLAKAYSPEEVELYLIDTKMVEFSKYRTLPHVKRCAIDIADGVEAAKECFRIMEARQKILLEANCKDISDYNRLVEEYNKTHPQNPQKKMSYVVLVCDEYGDFQGNWEFWSPIDAIGRKGRAMGVHLIFSTQRPSADTLPPSVKANMAAVLALKVRSTTNSRILLDNDMAFHLPLKKGRAIWQLDVPKIVQIPYISDEMVEKHLGIVVNKQLKFDAMNVLQSSDTDELKLESSSSLSESSSSITSESSNSDIKSKSEVYKPMTREPMKKEPMKKEPMVQDAVVRKQVKVVVGNRVSDKVKIKNSEPVIQQKVEQPTDIQKENQFRAKIADLEKQALYLNETFINPIGKQLVECKEKLNSTDDKIERQKLVSQGRKLLEEYKKYVAQRDELLKKANIYKTHVQQLVKARNSTK